MVVMVGRAEMACPEMAPWIQELGACVLPTCYPARYSSNISTAGRPGAYTHTAETKTEGFALNTDVSPSTVPYARFTHVHVN